MNIIYVKNNEEMALKAASIIAAQVTLKNDCVLGLATGGTPVGTYANLIKWCKEGMISFKNVRSVNLDEYCNLPVTHPESYRCFMNTNLFDHVDIDKANTNVPDGLAADSEKAAKDYDALIDSLGVDLQLLGIGYNGHIGFNEPDSAFTMGTHVVELTQSTLEANKRFFDNDISKVPTHAITMGMKNIMSAKRILLIGGAEKAEIIEKAFFGPVTPEVPASILQLHSDVTVVCVKA
ncbi:MAG: glucosamine-6-phosphate deaminase [Clostridia bacterium]|nr:glucosamine-6-phosphate deaminase [Clostridia bacterium]